VPMVYEVFNGPHVDRVVTGSKASAVIYGSSEERQRMMMNGFDDGQRDGWDGSGGARYKAFGTRASLRSTLWDAEHPQIDPEDVPVAVVKEVV
jgi:hypothetical protein